MPPGSLSYPVAGLATPTRAHSPGAAVPGRGPAATLRRDRGGRRPAGGSPAAAGGPAGRGRVAPPPPASHPGPTLIAHHPVKITALLITVAAGLIIFPRWVNQHEPRPDAAGYRLPAIPTEGLPLSTAALAGGPVEVGVGAVGGQVAIDVSTIPHGATIYLDTLPLAVPRVVLARADTRPHDIEARAGCFHAVAEMTSADLASFTGPLVLELQPRREPVTINSKPEGARIWINGRDTGKKTPASVEIDGCEKRTIRLARAGHQPWSKSYDSESDFKAMADALSGVALDPLPQGRVVIQKPKEYDVEVYAGRRRLGKAGRPLNLAEGQHTLTLRNDRFFLRQRARVTVVGGKTVARAVPLPSLGTLTVQAQPSNCKVYIDGKYVDVTPVINRPIVAGMHRVRVVFVPNGATRKESAEVKAGKNTRVMVKF